MRILFILVCMLFSSFVFANPWLPNNIDIGVMTNISTMYNTKIIDDSNKYEQYEQMIVDIYKQRHYLIIYNPRNAAALLSALDDEIQNYRVKQERLMYYIPDNELTLMYNKRIGAQHSIGCIASFSNFINGEMSNLRNVFFTNLFVKKSFINDHNKLLTIITGVQFNNTNFDGMYVTLSMALVATKNIFRSKIKSISGYSITIANNQEMSYDISEIIEPTDNLSLMLKKFVKVQGECGEAYRYFKKESLDIVRAFDLGGQAQLKISVGLYHRYTYDANTLSSSGFQIGMWISE